MERRQAAGERMYAGANDDSAARLAALRGEETTALQLFAPSAKQLPSATLYHVTKYAAMHAHNVTTTRHICHPAHARIASSISPYTKQPLYRQT